MTKKQALRRLASLTGGLFATQAAAAAHCRRHGRPCLGKLIMSTGVAADTLLLYAVLVPNFPLLGKVYHHGNRNGNKVALTFDDGPRPPYTGQVLDALGAAGVRATFFVLGENARRYPEAVRRIEAEGHRVANHGMDHDILMFASGAAALSQVMGAEAALRQAGVRDPALLFRAPHGWLSLPAHRAITRRGYRVVGWTKGVWDTANPGADRIVSRTSEVLAPGSILLLHDGWGGISA